MPCVKTNWYSLRNDIFVAKKVINLYISYTQDLWSKDLKTDFVLSNCLFGSVELTNNTDSNTNIAATAHGFIFIQNFY